MSCNDSAFIPVLGVDADTDIIYLFLNLLVYCSTWPPSYSHLPDLPSLPGPSGLNDLHGSLVRLASIILLASLVSLDFLVISTCLVSLTCRVFLFYVGCLASLVSSASMVSLTSLISLEFITNLLGLQELPRPPDRPGFYNLIFFSQASPVLYEHF